MNIEDISKTRRIYFSWFEEPQNKYKSKKSFCYLIKHTIVELLTNEVG